MDKTFKFSIIRFDIYPVRPTNDTGNRFIVKKHNAAGISKRVEMFLDLWSKVNLMSELPEKAAFALVWLSLMVS